MFFKDCESVADVKTLYRKLAKQHHPDHGGDVEVMKQLNSEYHDALKNLHGYKTKDGNKEFTYKYDVETEQVIMDQLYKFLSLKMENVDILLIGFWVWIKGDSKPHKESLKDLGCKWSSDKKVWYWKPPHFKKSYRSGKSLGQLANQYGATIVKEKENKQKRLAIA